MSSVQTSPTLSTIFLAVLLLLSVTINCHVHAAPGEAPSTTTAVTPSGVTSTEDTSQLSNTTTQAPTTQPITVQTTTANGASSSDGVKSKETTATPAAITSTSNNEISTTVKNRPSIITASILNQNTTKTTATGGVTVPTNQMTTTGGLSSTAVQPTDSNIQENTLAPAAPVTTEHSTSVPPPTQSGDGDDTQTKPSTHTNTGPSQTFQDVNSIKSTGEAPNYSTAPPTASNTTDDSNHHSTPLNTTVTVNVNPTGIKSTVGSTPSGAPNTNTNTKTGSGPKPTNVARTIETDRPGKGDGVRKGKAKSDDSSDGLTTGQEAGIAIVVIICILAIVVGVYIVYKRTNFTPRSLRTFLSGGVRYKTYTNATYKDDEVVVGSEGRQF